MQEPTVNNKNEDKKDRRFTDERTKQKIRKHLTDINDQITEDDIKNVNTNISSSNLFTGSIEQPVESINGDINKPTDDKKNEQNNTIGQIDSPYDILAP